MGAFCGIVDFTARECDFDALFEMWKTMSPLGRGFSYARGGISLACERGNHMSATHPAPRPTAARENCTVILASPPSSPLLASHILRGYLCEGLAGATAGARDCSFAVLDEKERMLALFSEDCPIFYARSGSKVVFASSPSALTAFSMGENSPICRPLKITPHSSAVFYFGG